MSSLVKCLNRFCAFKYSSIGLLLEGSKNFWLGFDRINFPLIISYKGINHSAAQSHALVEYVDLMPTFIDMAGFSVPSYLEGTSMKPVLENPDHPWKKAVFSRQSRGILEEILGFCLI